MCGRVASLHLADLDVDSEGLLAAAEHDAAEGADFVVVAAPGEGDVVVAWDDVVGGVEVDPAVAVSVYGKPCVCGLGAREGVSFGAEWADVAADVAGGNAEGAQACDLELSEILADAAFVGVYGVDGRCQRGCGRVVFEFAMYTRGQIERGGEYGAA